LENFKKYLGLALIVLGAVVLISLASTLSTYIQDFSSSPIHIYVTGFDTLEKPLAFSENEVSIPKEYLNIVALYLGFVFLGIWLKVGVALITSGNKLVVDDVENIKSIIKEHFSSK